MAVISLDAAWGSDFTAQTIDAYNRLLNQKRHVEALRLLDAALAKSPNSLAFMVAKANLYLIHKTPMAAVKLCRQALKLDNKFEWAMSTMGKAFVDLDRPDLGLKWIDEAIKIKNNPILLIERAELLLNLSRYEEAEKAFELAMTANPKNVDIVVDRAWNLRQMHRDRDEERLLIQAVKQFPKDRRALMAYTSHLKDRRHYSKSLQFLEMSDPANNPRYNLGFFTRTGLKGYSFSPIGIPFSTSLFDELGVEATNIENLTRSLKSQKIQLTALPSLAPIPRLVPRNLLRFDLSVFAPLFPIIRLSVVDDRKLNRQDGFFELRTDLITLSLETTFLWRGLGDVTLLPFIRSSFQGGDTLDIRSGARSEFSISKYTLGILSYLQPLIGGAIYEFEGAHAFGDVSDSLLRVSAQVPINDFVRLNTEINYICGSEYRFSADFTRLSFRFGTEVGPRDGMRGRAELRAIFRDDRLISGENYTYTYLTPHLTGLVPLHRRWSLEADLGLINNSRFTEYGGISGELFLAHRFFPIFRRRMTSVEFNYEAPIELKLGVKVNSFSNLPAGSATPLGIVASANFFW